MKPVAMSYLINRRVVLSAAAVGLWITHESRRMDAEAVQARQDVIDIVNQPITHLARSSEAGVFSPGWFQPGAIKPASSTP